MSRRTQLELAHAGRHRGPHADAHLDGLEEAGLVRRVREASDRRAVRVEFDGRGRATLPDAAAGGDRVQPRPDRRASASLSSTGCGRRSTASSGTSAVRTLEHEQDREDRSGVAGGALARAVPRAAPEGHRGAVQRRVRPHLRAGHVSLRRLRRGAVRVGHEVRLGLRLARVLRAGGRDAIDEESDVDATG